MHAKDTRRQKKLAHMWRNKFFEQLAEARAEKNNMTKEAELRKLKHQENNGSNQGISST